MGTIAKRSLINFLRNPILFKGRIAQSSIHLKTFLINILVFFTFLLCVLYFKITDNMNPNNLADPANAQVIYDINGAIFFFSIAVFMSSSMTVVLTFPAERAVFLREYSANMYSVSAYFFGRSSTELPFVVFFPLLLTSVSYYIIGFNDYSPSKFFIFRKSRFSILFNTLIVLVVIFMSITGNAVGILVGSIFEDVKVSTNVVPVISLLLFV